MSDVRGQMTDGTPIEHPHEPSFGASPVKQRQKGFTGQAGHRTAASSTGWVGMPVESGASEMKPNLPAHYLLIGGAGYIGSHVAREIIRKGHRVTILDNLSKGHREAVKGLTLFEGDLGDEYQRADNGWQRAAGAPVKCATLVTTMPLTDFGSRLKSAIP